MAGRVGGLKAIGHQGWTAMPKFGFGDTSNDLWWIVISTITMGVGIGVLAQPQLIVRFMTVKSKRELNKAVLVGGLFILVMTGVAFTVGALSNVYFAKHEKIVGKIVKIDENVPIVTKKNSLGPTTAPATLMHIDTTGSGEADTHIISSGLGIKAQVNNLPDGKVEVMPKATSFTRAVTLVDNKWELSSDSIIPIYITSALPKWFGLLFLLTLLAAAMSTLSSQFHTMGTAAGRDIFEQLSGSHGKSISITRIAIIIGIIIATLMSHYIRGGYIIARATAIFFGLCASAFLPAFVGGLFFKRVTKAGALASMAVGFIVTAFWLVFVKAAEADAIGLVYRFTDKQSSILWKWPNWPNVDPLVVALPLSILTMIIVSLLTKPPQADHVKRCFTK